MKKIDSIRLAIATWIAPAGTVVVPPVPRMHLGRPDIAPTVSPGPVTPMTEFELRQARGMMNSIPRHRVDDTGITFALAHKIKWSDEEERYYRQYRKLKIIDCKDPSMWYAGKVGELVEYSGIWPEGWKSRESSGMINIIKPDDAMMVKF